MTKRPRKKARPGEYVGFRSPAALKAQLERAAQQNFRSLSSEAQFRLESTFTGDDLLDQTNDRAHGRDVAGLLMLLARVMKDTGPVAGVRSAGTTDWLSNPYAFDQVVKAVNQALEGLRPDGDTAPPEETDDARTLGEKLARGALIAVGDPDCGGELGDWAKPVRKRLDPKRITVDPEKPVALNAFLPHLLAADEEATGHVIDTHLGRGFIGRWRKS